MLSRHMAINVQVEKNNNESTANLIRRFTKRVQGSGLIPRMRGNRYYEREKSRNVKKASRLLKLEKQQKYEKLLKLGKIQEAPRGRRK
jgi:ribosomal protein S21